MVKKRKQIQPMKYPVGVEYSYRRILNGLVTELKKIVKQEMSPKVPQMVMEAGDIHALPTGTVKQDAWESDLIKVMQRIADRMMTPTNKAIKEMQRIGPQINEFNKKEWQKLIRSQYGVDPLSEDPDRWNPLLKDWSQTNAALIKDIPALTMKQISEETVDALQSGKNLEDMASDIFDIMAERTDVSMSRANLIARDQTAKLNGQFTEERQADLGVSHYTWRTVGDERVRPTHMAVDGEVFSWDAPPDETDGNHPGQDFQCRCWAEPILPETIAFRASLLGEAA